MIRVWEPGDAARTRDLSALLGEYLLATEREKGARADAVAALPERYRAEVASPATALAGCTVLLAFTRDDAVAGCLVLAPPAAGIASGGVAEIKRLWVRPEHRGQGHARALLEACIVASEERGDAALRLTVWEWRAGAIALYASAGFVQVDSWDHRARLVCMERPREGAVGRAPQGTGEA